MPPHLLSLAAPLVGLALSSGLPWHVAALTWGWITLGLAGMYGLAAWALTRLLLDRSLARTQALVAMVLLTLALGQILHGDVLLLAVAAQATALHLIFRRPAGRGLALYAHLLFAGVAVLLLYRLARPAAGAIPFLNPPALSNLAVIAMALVSSVAHRLREERMAYRLVVHLAVLALVLRELAPQAGGQGYATVAWGLYAAGLLIVGLRLDRGELRLAGLGTLGLVVAKLLVVDLDQVEAIWRILLFLGFGGLFLALSYYFRALWHTAGSRGTAAPREDRRAGGPASR